MGVIELNFIINLSLLKIRIMKKFMKTTVKVAAISLVVGVGMTSCGKPQMAEDISTKVWVFRNCISTDVLEDIRDAYEVSAGFQDLSSNEFTMKWQDVFDRGIYCFEIDGRYDDPEIDILNDNELDKSLQSIWQERDRRASQIRAGERFVWVQEDERWLYLLTPEERAEAEEIVRDHIFEFRDFYVDLIDDAVKVLDWEEDPDTDTKLCKGYFITYEIDSDFYALVHLTEYKKDSDQCEVEIIYSGESLSELTTYLN